MHSPPDCALQTVEELPYICCCILPYAEARFGAADESTTEVEGTATDAEETTSAADEPTTTEVGEG
jgi:hypothetical protein